jgi:hypothetical protein
MSRIAERYFGDTPASYPQAPGYRERSTSRDAALSVKESADDLRALVLAEIAKCPRTVHEMAELLDRLVSSVQPRFSELRAAGKIAPSGERRRNPTSNKRAHVWRLA